jgi:hypothetical protein
MSSIKLESNSSGTGIFTIASPNSNTNRTLTLPDSTGTVVVTGGAQTIEFAAGSASTPSITTTGDTNTGIFFPAADTIAFGEGGAESMRIDGSGNVGIGTSTIRGRLTVSDGAVNTAGEGVHQAYIAGTSRTPTSDVTAMLTIQSTNALAADVGGSIAFGGRAVSGSDAGANWATIAGFKENATTANYGGYIQFATRPNSGAMAERARITSGGDLLVAKTAVNNAVVGVQLEATGFGSFVRSANVGLLVGRNTDDGDLVLFRQDNTTEGSISVSGTTVSYNGGNLSRWAQMLTKPDLLKGTVMSNLDEMNVYTKDGEPVENEQLNKVKVSDVEGDVNVAGVFVNWTYDDAHQIDEINMAMTGDMIIRIAQGVVVQKGDLLMSAGDGTAKPQDDDIVRSKTVAKVTSNHVTCTYADGSYCVPCVLMAC